MISVEGTLRVEILGSVGLSVGQSVGLLRSDFFCVIHIMIMEVLLFTF